DKEPQSSDARDRCTNQCHGCNRGRGDATQEHSGKRSPQRQCYQEDEGNGSKGVDRVVEDLRQKPRPQYLEAETERARASRDQAQASDPYRGDTGAAGLVSRVSILLPHSNSKCSQASEEARPGRGTVACAHTDHGWEPEAHGDGPEHTTQNVEGVE